MNRTNLVSFLLCHTNGVHVHWVQDATVNVDSFDVFVLAELAGYLASFGLQWPSVILIPLTSESCCY